MTDKIPVGKWIYTPTSYSSRIAQVTGGGLEQVLVKNSRIAMSDVWFAGDTKEDAMAAQARHEAVMAERRPGWEAANKASNDARIALSQYNAASRALAKTAASGQPQ